MNLKTVVTVLIHTIAINLFSLNLTAAVGDEIRYLPVQDSGRVKPFDTFAKETLELVHGRKDYKPSEDVPKIEARWVVLTWMLAPETWVSKPLFEVNHLKIKEKLNLDLNRKHFTGDEVFKAVGFANLMQELQDKRQTKEKMDPYFQAIQRLENQFYVFREMAAGKLMHVMPVADQDKWVAVADLPSELQSYFVELSKSVAVYLGSQASPQSSESEKKINAGNLDKNVLKFEEMVGKSDPLKYKVSEKTRYEVLYNDLHPFRWAYIFYLISALILLFIWIRKSEKGMQFAWIFLGLGFLIHTLGFAFRIYLAERPPVTNMYETVIWSSWGAILFSIILEIVYKFRVLLLGGSLVGILCLVLADVSPAVLDPSLQPLEAVLRSNYWLIVHVMTISISYAAFLLAFGLGDLGLIYYCLDSKKYDEQLQKITTGVYRAIQIGVAFLTPGIILGGVWADYSWGRFWGWDPKETWALIVLLGYIVVLHARLVGWLKNFGMLASGVIAFSLVIMAWYGVNFVLGAGLHSYGFGAGGVEYVSVFVGLHILFVIYAYFKYQKTTTR